MAWENWPQTNVHELNLDWMLNKIKELSAQLETNLEPVYDAIAKGDSNTLASAKNYADSVGDDVKAYADSSINHTNDLLADLADQLSNAISNIYQSISNGDLSTLSYVNSEILKIYDELNKIKYNFAVYNPCRAKETSVNLAVNDLYTYLAYGGISALESETVNVNSIDEYLSNVLKFDLSGRKRLIKILSDTYMYSAYDGIKKPVWNEVGLNTLNSQSISPPSEKFENVSVADVDNVNVKTFDFDYGTNK